MWSMMRPRAVWRRAGEAVVVEEAVVETTRPAERPKPRPPRARCAWCWGAEGTWGSARRLQPRFPIGDRLADRVSICPFSKTASLNGFGRPGRPLETSKQSGQSDRQRAELSPQSDGFLQVGPYPSFFWIGLLLRDFSERHDGRRVTRRGCAETFESGVRTSKTSGRCEQVVLVFSECGLKWSTGFYWINLKLFNGTHQPWKLVKPEVWRCESMTRPM